MKKGILFALLLLILSSPAFGQKKVDDPKPKCMLALDQSPELRGFRLGMTQAAVLARLPGATVEKPDKFGLARLRLSIIDSTSLIKPSAREKGVQPDMLAGPNDGSAFVVDSSRFPALKGTRKIQMRFIDGRLSHLQISYNDDVKWDSVDQIVEMISTTLKLPNEWQTPADSDSGQEKELRCEGFVIAANTIGDPTDIHAGPELILQDVAAWSAMSKRQNDITEKAKRDEDEKRKSFKP
jgi:hypothetical protein